MAGSGGVEQIMASLGLDFSSAITSVDKMTSKLTSLEEKLKEVENVAKGTDVTPGGKGDVGGAKSARDMLRTQKELTGEYEKQGVKVKQSTLEQLRAQAATIIQRTHADRLSEDYKKQAQYIKEGLEYMIRMNLEKGRLTETQTEILRLYEDELKVMRAQMTTDVAEHPTGFFGSELGRRVGWFLSGTAFYGTLSAAKEAISTIRDVEFGMVEIGRVMEDATFRTEEYRDALMRLGVEYGQTFENVHDVALRWAQAGYNVADSLELTETAMLALNTAELDATNATEAMVGIMSQWQLQASELELVMDKINKTADSYTLTSQDLVDGLLRSSGAARVMNMSIDETIALLTVMREASGRTGREVGKKVAPYRSNPISKYVLNSGEPQRWAIVSQAA